ncbi:Fic family protein [Polaromonas sp. YR568]|uniref:Fic family protein n=1 Tax=Polaromonas sp. YR568 TaxID=1855301 RepID=UPI00398BF189
MFDPFGDFSSMGYLRNSGAEKNLEIIKAVEHQLFRAQLPEALDFLARLKRIEYSDFLEVHRILFSGLYPWAGKDRAEVLPDRAVSKGSVFFCHPRDCRRAVQEGLFHAQDKKQIRTRSGFIMGMFAYGHPFLDGNGRTMLLVHAELCFRAGMSVDWTRTSKEPYLQSLTREIEDPNAGHLDAYLGPFISAKIPRESWLQSVAALPGLDGASAQSDTSAQYADPAVAASYQAFERRRGYKLA